MDFETMQRLEREADERDQTAAVLEHWKRKADRRRFWAFCFNWRQVVDEPVAAVTTPREHLPSSLGVVSGEADSQTRTLPHTSPPGFVGPAAPQPAIRPVGRGAATPHTS